MGRSVADDRYRKSAKGRQAKKRQNQRYRDRIAAGEVKKPVVKRPEEKILRIVCTYTESTGTEDFYAFLEVAAMQNLSAAEMMRVAIRVYLEYINSRKVHGWS